MYGPLSVHSKEITGGGFVEAVGGDVWEELVVFKIRLVEEGTRGPLSREVTRGESSRICPWC